MFEFWLAQCPPGAWVAGALNMEYGVALMLTPVLAIGLIVGLVKSGGVSSRFLIFAHLALAAATVYEYYLTCSNHYCIGPNYIEVRNSLNEKPREYNWTEVADIRQDCIVRSGHDSHVVHYLTLELQDKTSFIFGISNMRSPDTQGIIKVLAKARGLGIREILNGAPDCPLTPLLTPTPDS